MIVQSSPIRVEGYVEGLLDAEDDLFVKKVSVEPLEKKERLNLKWEPPPKSGFDDDTIVEKTGLRCVRKVKSELGTWVASEECTTTL